MREDRIDLTEAEKILAEVEEEGTVSWDSVNVCCLAGVGEGLTTGLRCPADLSSTPLRVEIKGDTSPKA